MPRVLHTSCILVLAVLELLTCRPVDADGTLDGIRNDVRTAPPPSNSAPDDSRPQCREDHGFPRTNDAGDNSLTFATFVFALEIVASPYWLPVAITDDHYSYPLHFPDHPYDDADGHLVDPIGGAIDLLSEDPGDEEDHGEKTPAATTPGRPLRLWSARLGAEYGNTFDGVDRVSGNFLFSSASRWGIDSQWHFLQERLSGGGYDSLAVGNCNLVFRFAQSPRAEFRTGLGANWLSDSSATNLGFNFNYAVDFFPQKPWVLSASLDAGWLDHAGVIHVRTTIGLLWRCLETYTGYDYYDIGREPMNSLIGGLRLWF